MVRVGPEDDDGPEDDGGDKKDNNGERIAPAQSRGSNVRKECGQLFCPLHKLFIGHKFADAL